MSEPATVHGAVLVTGAVMRAAIPQQTPDEPIHWPSTDSDEQPATTGILDSGVLEPETFHGDIPGSDLPVGDLDTIAVSGTRHLPGTAIEGIPLPAPEEFTTPTPQLLRRVLDGLHHL